MPHRDHIDHGQAMDADAIDRAIIALAPDAVAAIERCLRSTDKVDRTRIDAARWVLKHAATASPSRATVDDVAQLGNVLRMVEP